LSPDGELAKGVGEGAGSSRVAGAAGGMATAREALEDDEPRGVIARSDVPPGAESGPHVRAWYRPHMPAKPKTIDEYLDGVGADRRVVLQKLRQIIHALAPGVQECISYSMPAFRLDGRVVAGFLATAKGCSYFPFSGTTLDALGDELAGYERTKSAVHFEPKHPLPKALVKKLLDARIAETERRPPRSSATPSAGGPRAQPTKPPRGRSR
jgi:uncharacterized protein YdhG (YjbR/CyaY superfamily)